MQLSDLGEREAIDRIWKVAGRAMPYDDCVYVASEDKYTLYTMDFIGEGTHFIREWNAALIGSFFASINLSDIAAMGGIPEFFMASMFFPRDASVNFLESFVRGMLSLLDKFNVPYYGGDFKESRNMGMTGFAVGHVEKDKILRRDKLNYGEGVFLTGPLGKQAAGYILWKKGHEEGVKYILDVIPRIHEGRSIAGMGSACMDLSDGILAAVRFLRNSKYGIRIDFDELPVHPLAYEVAEDYKIPLISLLTFGGEYELIYTASTRVLGREIGKVVDLRSAGLWKGNKRVEGEGYAHFGKALEKTG